MCLVLLQFTEHAISRSDKQTLGYTCTYSLIFKYPLHDHVMVERKLKMLSLCAYNSCVRKLSRVHYIQLFSAYCIIHGIMQTINLILKSEYFYELYDEIFIK